MTNGNGPQQIRAWAIGLDMAYSLIGMLLLGAAIDYFAGTKPWWMLGLGLLGLVVGMYRFIRDAARMNQRSGRGTSWRPVNGAGTEQNPAEQEKPGSDGSPGG